MTDYVFYIVFKGLRVEYTWIKTLTNFTPAIYVFRLSAPSVHVDGPPEFLHAKGIGGEMYIMDEDASLGEQVYKELAPIKVGSTWVHRATKAPAKVLAVGHHLTEGTPMVAYDMQSSTSILGGVLFLDTTQFYELHTRSQA